MGMAGTWVALGRKMRAEWGIARFQQHGADVGAASAAMPFSMIGADPSPSPRRRPGPRLRMPHDAAPRGFAAWVPPSRGRRRDLRGGSFKGIAAEAAPTPAINYPAASSA